MRIEAVLKKALFGINPWIPLFAFTALFQFIRESYFDGIFFIFVVLVLVVEWKKIFPYQFPNRPKMSFWFIVAICVLIAAVFLLVPRKSVLEITLMFALLLTGLGLIWYKDAGPVPSKGPEMTRAKWLWIVLGILIALWELFAYILSDVANDSYAYPTISILMSPFMASDWGRALFVVLWLALGIGLLRLLRPR